MNLEQYAAQHTQEQQQAQLLEALPVDIVAAKLDAERLSSLLDDMQEAINEQATPAAILTRITGAMFGEKSPQAAAVAAIIDADKHPGGHEMALAGIRQRRKLLKQQQKQIEEQARAIADELETLDESERAITRNKADAAALDAALIETLAFCKGIDPQRDMLKEISELYDRHHGNPAAMGLLYGSIEELTRKQYSAGRLDLVQQQEFISMKERIAAAIRA